MIFNIKNSSISEEKQEICQICYNIKRFIHILHTHLIMIDEFGLNLKNIEMNLKYFLVYVRLIDCERYNLGKNFPSSRITYKIKKVDSRAGDYSNKIKKEMKHKIKQKEIK